MIPPLSMSPPGGITPLVAYRHGWRNRGAPTVKAPALEVKRHYREPSAKEAEEIVQTVAELIVDFVKGHRETEPPAASERPKGAMQTKEPR